MEISQLRYLYLLPTSGPTLLHKAKLLSEKISRAYSTVFEITENKINTSIEIIITLSL